MKTQGEGGEISKPRERLACAPPVPLRNPHLEPPLGCKREHRAEPSVSHDVWLHDAKSARRPVVVVVVVIVVSSVVGLLRAFLNFLLEDVSSVLCRLSRMYRQKTRAARACFRPLFSFLLSLVVEAEAATLQREKQSQPIVEGAKHGKTWLPPAGISDVNTPPFALPLVYIVAKDRNLLNIRKSLMKKRVPLDYIVELTVIEQQLDGISTTNNTTNNDINNNTPHRRHYRRTFHQHH